MPSPVGQFVWYEVMTTDPEAATDFYRQIIGWNAKDFPMEGGVSYTVLSRGETMVAGLMALPPEAAAMGVPPCWSGYVAVEDVDAGAARVQELGGKIARPPADIPKVGRFAVVSDPGGAVFLLFKPSTNETPAKVAPMT